jgi:hypothetical protein
VRGANRIVRTPDPLQEPRSNPVRGRGEPKRASIRREAARVRWKKYKKKGVKWKSGSVTAREPSSLYHPVYCTQSYFPRAPIPRRRPAARSTSQHFNLIIIYFQPISPTGIPGRRGTAHTAHASPPLHMLCSAVSHPTLSTKNFLRHRGSTRPLFLILVDPLTPRIPC